MGDQHIATISSRDLENLINILEVKFVALSQCSVSSGYALELGGVDAPGIHYNLMGKGFVIFGNDLLVELVPDTLVIVPANTSFRIGATTPGGDGKRLKSVDGRSQTAINDGVRKFVAGYGDPEIILFCGYFHATYGVSTDLFANLSMPIVEGFTREDRLDTRLREAMDELVAQELGAGAMSATLLKQLIVLLLRRSLSSPEIWALRFPLYSDGEIARVFSRLVAHPAAEHTIESLAREAHLSRSAFMQRFTSAIGRPPMSVLRDLRMRQAVQQLMAGLLSIDEVVRNAGYESRSSFGRAFKKLYGCGPADFKPGGQTD
ncbi:MAG TPA: AraC family transcriptional regulator [Puia sp.]|jgi:AraC family transcriptional activator of mtrCDE